MGGLLRPRGLSPHDPRKAADTRAPEGGLSYGQAQMMSKLLDPKTLTRQDRGGRSLKQNSVDFLAYEEVR
jgi:hypothetical protein